MKTSDIQSGRSDNNYFAKRRLRLLEKDPRCHWCKREVKDYPDYSRMSSQYPVGHHKRKMPDDYATIDHLKSRFNGPRKDVKMQEKTLVLACPKCNNERQRIEHAKNVWKTRWKSGSFPKPFRWFGRLLKWYRAQRRTTCLKGQSAEKSERSVEVVNM